MKLLVRMIVDVFFINIFDLSRFSKLELCQYWINLLFSHFVIRIFLHFYAVVFLSALIGL